MPIPEVIEQVRQLRTQLVDTDPAVPDAASLVGHLDNVLVEPAHPPRYEGLGDRLRAVSASIESSHPQLAASMNTVINALSAAGV